jgi:hypothetical protein
MTGWGPGKDGRLENRKVFIHIGATLGDNEF